MNSKSTIKDNLEDMKENIKENVGEIKDKMKENVQDINLNKATETIK